MRAVIDSLGAHPFVLLTVSTPDELAGWPIDAWILLDCKDEIRRQRFDGRGDEADDAITDAARYRRLGLPTVDSSHESPSDVAGRVEQLIRELDVTGGTGSTP